MLFHPINAPRVSNQKLTSNRTIWLLLITLFFFFVFFENNEKAIVSFFKQVFDLVYVSSEATRVQLTAEFI